MRIKVRLFAILRDLAGEGEMMLSLEHGASVHVAMETLAAKYPRLAPHLPRVATAVNQAYVKSAEPLRDGDELALIPPVSGG
jgi:molybdopterin converting factor subunit 1